MGYSVSGAGDVNGDGFDDLIIGAPGYDEAGGVDNLGTAYVLFGKSAGFAPEVALLNLMDGSQGFQINPNPLFDFGAGYAVSAAGDMNGDGFGDVIVGVRDSSYTGGSGGAAYVVFGKASGFGSSLDAGALEGTNGFAIWGPAYSELGASVSSAGDVNGDGFDDIIIGTQGTGYNSRAVVVFGKSSGFTDLDAAAYSVTVADDLTGSNGFAMVGDVNDGFGWSVSGAGDVNGDGYDDLLIGAPKVGFGTTYVVYGKASGFAAEADIESLIDGGQGFSISGDAGDAYAGRSVSAAGDLDGDGFDDLIVGVSAPDLVLGNPPSFPSTNGRSYVIFGGDFNGAAGVMGTDGADELDGGAGDQVLKGGSGNDALGGGAGNDRIEGDGGNDALDGGGDDDRLAGGDGADTLDGGSGNDTLLGGSGDDGFLFDDALGGSNVDTIMDFGGAGSEAMDVIRLDNAVFASLTVEGLLSADNFVSGVGPSAADGDDYILYDTATGELFYDADGSGAGAAAKFALLASSPDGLAASDFLVT
jgi:hypothetical protein